MSDEPTRSDIIDVIVAISTGLESASVEFAVGGAIALGYWGTPRATLDVDVTLFIQPLDIDKVIAVLKQLGCEFDERQASQSFREHDFCRIKYYGVDVDVFLPTISFYATARARRRRVPIDGHETHVWDAETLCVFKMMFFRLKDLADVEDIIRVQANQLDHQWIGQQIESIYGRRDPRCTRWRELSSGSSTDL